MLSVVLLTYNRFDYAVRTLDGLKRNLQTTFPIKVIIASDGDTKDYIDYLHSLACMWVGHLNVSHTNSERGGYGKNYNLAMQSAHESEWIMPIEDDWELTRPLNVDALIEDMGELSVGCARLGYIGYTQALRGTLMYGAACGHWLGFDSASTEPHVFAGHPRIERRTWSRSVGPWAEGLQPGETEFEVTHRAAARTSVAWPLDIVKPSGGLFAHIGTVRSW